MCSVCRTVCVTVVLVAGCMYVYNLRQRKLSLGGKGVHAMQLKPWKKEGGDHTLLDLMPFLEAIYRANVPDVRKVVQSYEGQDIPVAFRYAAVH